MPLSFVPSINDLIRQFVLTGDKPSKSLHGSELVTNFGDWLEHAILRLCGFFSLKMFYRSSRIKVTGCPDENHQDSLENY